MSSKIEDLSKRLDKISQRRGKLGLVEMPVTGVTQRSSNATWQPIPTTSLPKETVVYGRDVDKRNIIDLLLNPNIPGDLNFHVLPIVGMGGLGKTTLSQQVYNDPAIQDFDVKSWVCVSTDFDVTRITKAILVEVTSQHHELTDLQLIQVKLQAALSGKKFLIVLDDIWDKNYGKWEVLRSPLMVGAPGSKVIVTTRDKEVASMTGSLESYELKLLSDDDCWSLFKNHAFENRDLTCAYPNLKSISEKERCRGLPLAARTLGGLLRHKSMDEWDDVFNSKMWSLSTAESDIFPLLRLSYYNLSPELKRCFSYCAIFPQDYEFTENQMVFLWIGEGFVQPVDGNQQVVQVGHRYFRELVARSIFQASSNGASQFVMHDLVHELAERAAGKTCFTLGNNLKSCEHPSGFERARHSSYNRGHIDNITRFEVFSELKRLRTFLPVTIDLSYFSHLSNNVVVDILPKLKQLRVLSLSGYLVYELPEEIGDLKHLRYFDLSKTCIRYLPESTCSLYNLESLILANCIHLQRLPSKMENLVNLCYLNIKNVRLLEEMPVGLKDLKSLQKLSDFILKKDGGGSRIQELMHLNSLHGSLCISNLASVVDAQDAREANLNEKKNLVGLKLMWSREFDDSQDQGNEKQVLDMLQPHGNLEKLTIRCYPGNELSSWLGDPLFFKMKHLKLIDCKRCTFLPPLGQLPSLEVLYVQGIGVKKVGAELFGSNNTSKHFPMLKILSFEDMLEWENWNGFDNNETVKSLPQLQKLYILNCPKFLGELPNHHPSLCELYIQDCPELLGEFPSHLPALKKLWIYNCNKLNVSISGLLNLQKLLIYRCRMMECRSTFELTKLEYVEIFGCEELIGETLPCTVKGLTLGDCLRLQRLPVVLSSFSHIMNLTIDGVPNLISLPSVPLWSSVHGTVRISNCEKLQSLLDENDDNIKVGRSTSTTAVVKELVIDNCPSLKCLSSTRELPTSLSKIYIKHCANLEYIARNIPVSLTRLEILLCEHLKLITAEELEAFLDSSRLEIIKIFYCSDLRSLPKGLHKLSLLNEVNILGCPKLICFPEGGLPTNGNLRTLSIIQRDRLKALPDGMQNLVASVEEFHIQSCPDINLVPEELGVILSTAKNLTSLTVSGVNNCWTRSQWGCLHLHTRTSLKTLKITRGSPNMEEMVIKFPTSLTELYIGNFPNVKHISSNCFQNLTSLTHMSICNFPNLKKIPSNCFRNLTSLEYLCIQECSRLKSLPKEGLPLSLLMLYISDCPLLEKRCKRNDGKYWSYISHVPCITINGKSPYETSE